MAIITSTVTASLAEANPYYVTLNAGAAKLKEFCTNTASAFNCTDIAPAMMLAGGFPFNDTFGLELGLGYYGAPQIKGVLLGRNYEVAHETYGMNLSGTASYPVSKSAAIIAKLGVSHNVLNAIVTGLPVTSASNTALTYGIGIKYIIHPSYSLRVQYEYLGKVGDETTGTDTLSLLTVGVSYNFTTLPSRTISNKRL